MQQIQMSLVERKVALLGPPGAEPGERQRPLWVPSHTVEGLELPMAVTRAVAAVARLDRMVPAQAPSFRAA